MLSPEARYAAYRLIEILLALLEALAAPASGDPRRPLLTRLALRVLTHQLSGLKAQLEDVARAPAPTPENAPAASSLVARAVSAPLGQRPAARPALPCPPRHLRPVSPREPSLTPKTHLPTPGFATP